MKFHALHNIHEQTIRYTYVNFLQTLEILIKNIWVVLKKCDSSLSIKSVFVERRVLAP